MDCMGRMMQEEEIVTERWLAGMGGAALPAHQTESAGLPRPKRQVKKPLDKG